MVRMGKRHVAGVYWYVFLKGIWCYFMVLYVVLKPE